METPESFRIRSSYDFFVEYSVIVVLRIGAGTARWFGINDSPKI